MPVAFCGGWGFVRQNGLEDIASGSFVSGDILSECKAPRTRSSRTILIGEMPMSSLS
jgi:hypothetical protein